jgi:hypothetical protein
MLSPLEFIPNKYIKDLVALIKGERALNRDNGEWIEPTTPEKIDFKGAILPLSSRDLNQLKIQEDGIFSINDKKLYTNKDFLNRTQITDGLKNYETYVAKDYDIINSGFRIYYIKKIDKIDG